MSFKEDEALWAISNSERHWQIYLVARHVCVRDTIMERAKSGKMKTNIVSHFDSFEFFVGIKSGRASLLFSFDYVREEIIKSSH